MPVLRWMLGDITLENNNFKKAIASSLHECESENFDAPSKKVNVVTACFTIYLNLSSKGHKLCHDGIACGFLMMEELLQVLTHYPLQ